MRMPPWPVAVATGIYALVILAMLAAAIIMLRDGIVPLGVVGLAFSAVLALITRGLWRGRRGDRRVACVVAVGLVLVGLQQLGLGNLLGLFAMLGGTCVGAALLVPQASRAWFSAPTRPR